MKKYNKIILIFTCLSLFLLTSCEKDFDKINTNPNASEKDASIPALLSQTIRDFGYWDYDVWYGGRQANVCAQITSQRNYTSEDRYSFRSGTTDGFFRNNFFYINNLQKIIQFNTDPAVKGNYQVLYGDNGMQIAIAEIMKAWAFQLLTDNFGDIPYSQALNIDKYPQPKYDSQKEVYDGLLASLGNAVSTLKGLPEGSKGFASGDLFYKGDLTSWIKFGNSLRLRVALRASGRDAIYMTLAQDLANKSSELLESNSENAACRFSTTGAPNQSPWYAGTFEAKRNDFTYTHRFIEMLKGNDVVIEGKTVFANPFKGIKDPRYVYITTDETYARVGMPYGMQDADTKAWWGATKRISFTGLNVPVVRANYPSTFLDYPTVCFMVCELKGWDASWFEKGVKASLERLQVSDDTYVAAVMAKFVAATAEQKKEMCITQKYINLFDQPQEAWAEYRRTGYPKTIVKPGEVTINFGGANLQFTPVGGSESGNDIIQRMKYPNSEFTLNKTNVNAAVARMGEDTHATKVWWAGGK